ncbi:DUF2459 domain-containing protein [Candidatus Methylobacter oryzae]|uniref:DUF2459 domain-containing protein n=2 Tax=Candidatus Methylobacter oryzae TaxID=2497749 RepID=A0ABY3C9P3_9GAMM|nr:DUF2459 domain-containing protein [Candidatus Methylobacter oryzae]
MKRVCFMFIILAVSACSSVVPPPCSRSMTGDVAYVVDHGWHVEIGIPVEELDRNMSFYRKIFPGARVIMFSYGKQTFFTAPKHTINDYVLGPFPGPAVIQVVGLSVAPAQAYFSENTVTLLLPPNGSQLLSAYIWKDIVKDASGKPKIAAYSHDPAGLFYEAQSEYNLLHTCNTWVADALHDSGLSVSGDNVILSNQVMARIAEAAVEQCKVLP